MHCLGSFFYHFMTKMVKFIQKWPKSAKTMHYSWKTGGFAPADFLLQIIGLKIDYNQLLLAKSELFEGRNSKNGEINVFLDCFQLILMGFLTTSLHKNSQNDVKLLETWWFWHILGKGTHIDSNQKHPDFHQKSPWTPKSQLSPVWGGDQKGPKKFRRILWTAPRMENPTYPPILN